MLKFLKFNKKNKEKSKEQEQTEKPTVGKLSQKLQTLASKQNNLYNKSKSTSSSKSKKTSWSTLPLEELKQNYEKLKLQHKELRFKLVTESLSRNHQIKVVKKDIARALTYINKYKQLEQSKKIETSKSLNSKQKKEEVKLV